MTKQSAGLLLYRRRGGGLEVFLVHPGGPYWQNKDAGAWSIPKGEIDDDEDPLVAAKREFHEETGLTIAGDFIPMSAIKQRGSKKVLAWLAEADFDAASVKSNTFSMEWPPRSGKMKEFGEVDRADWFTLDVAMEKILESQRPLLEEAQQRISNDSSANG